MTPVAPKPFNRILWWGNVRNLSVSERARFARLHGFDALNIAPADICNLLDQGETLASIRTMAEDEGVVFTYLDPIVDWVPNWTPGPDAADFQGFLEAGLGREVEFAAALGIDRLLTITPFPSERYEMNALADHLSVFAEGAAGAGITCVVEAMPMWGLKRFADVVELQRRTAAQGTRILFDTWHYMRGGRDDALIATVPAGVIDHVQVADGYAQTPTGMTLFEECLTHRCPPGEGALPLRDILVELRDAGHLTSTGPEVFSAELDALPFSELAERLMPAFESCLADALSA